MRMGIRMVAIAILAMAATAVQASDEMSLAARMAAFRAQQALAAEEIPRAVDILETYKDTHTGAPTPFVINFLLGNCHAMADRWSDAVACYEAAADQNPNDASLWQNLARSYIDLKQYTEAAAAFSRLYDLTAPKNPQWLYHAGVCHMMDDRPCSALPIFRRLMADHLQALTLAWKASVVHAYLGCGQGAPALPLIRELAHANTGDERRKWQEVLLHQYLQLDMAPEALALAKRLVREDSLEPRWWKGLAHLQLEGGRHRPALVALTVYGLLTPLTDDESRLLADLNASIDLPGPAAEAYTALAEKRPDDSELVARLVRLYRRLGQPEIALEWTASEGLARSPEVQLRLRAEVLFDLKRWQEAASAYRALLDLRPAEARAWLMLGYASWNDGNVADARNALQTASRFDETRSAARRALNQLRPANRYPDGRK
jgi:tetratricopeptide (TPR) repeat protein